MFRVDVYQVIEAFGVTCPARAHAVKKLLCAGSRGKGTELDDLIGADAALSRAIELQRDRDAKHTPPAGAFDRNLELVRLPFAGCRPVTLDDRVLV